MSVVTFESKMAEKARSWDASTAAARLLPEAFVDEHVCIHGHADGEHDAGDARHGHGELEHGHRAEGDERRQHEAKERNRAGEAVVDGHEQRRHHKRRDAREHTLLDRVGTEGGGDFALAEDVDGVFERIFEHAGERADFLFREIAGDDGGAAEVIGLERQSGDDLTVDDDGEALVLVDRCHLVEEVGPLAGEDQIHLPAFGIVRSVGAGDILAVQVGAVLQQQRLLRP
mgnify:CR=1 FL=1